ncbi:MAG TPA: TraR/DksA C4-type zinc finger protein [Ferruginibacter sp.]|nr:TraR/DksA C4-type zinc finger protein [Ferruginibacter sp.]
MATNKKSTKPAAKKPAPKKVVKPTAKKAAPAPKKAAKPVAKKVVAKPVPKKAAVKPAVKKAVPAPKKVTKPVAKKAASAPKKVVSAPKKVVPAPKKAAKPVAPAKPVAKPAAKAIVAPAPKKEEPKKAAAIAKPVTPVKPAGIKANAQNPKDIKITPAKTVSIPKINTKTARTYQPDFTKSVLDQPKVDPGAPIVRYSDNDLTEFRELIQRKLGTAKKELNYLQGLITRKDDMGGDETDNRYMTMEDGSLSMEREQLSQMASRQITFIDHLEKALMRIENKTYGICRVTGKLIDKARLRAVPHATLSIEAKMGQVK